MIRLRFRSIVEPGAMISPLSGLRAIASRTRSMSATFPTRSAASSIVSDRAAAWPGKEVVEARGLRIDEKLAA
jgi:hypothetical protein